MRRDGSTISSKPATSPLEIKPRSRTSSNWRQFVSEAFDHFDAWKRLCQSSYWQFEAILMSLHLLNECVHLTSTSEIDLICANGLSRRKDDAWLARVIEDQGHS